MLRLRIAGIEFVPIFVMRSDEQRSNLYSLADKHNLNVRCETNSAEMDGKYVIFIDSHRGEVSQTSTDVQEFIKDISKNQKNDWIQDRGFYTFDEEAGPERVLIFWHKESLSRLIDKKILH